MDYQELIKKPINEEKPAGENARYEHEYIDLQNEIDKLAGVTEQIDWTKVLKLALKILSEKSKDLKVALYLTDALANTEKLDGFAQGIVLLSDLLENFWDGLFPDRENRRKKMIEGFIEKYADFLSSLDIPPQPVDKIKALTESIKKIDSFLAEKMEDAPLFRPLESGVARIPLQEEKKTESAPSKPVDTSTAAAAAPPHPVERSPVPVEESASDVSSIKEAKKELNRILPSLRKIAGAYLKENQAQGTGYRYNRIAAWLQINQAPLADKKKTQIPPPDAQTAKALETLYNNQDWENLLTSAESNISRFIYWFDLHRYVSESLGQLGGNYRPAREIVDQMTASFVGRLKGVENMTFSDGTPFADPATKQWLKSIAPSSRDEDGFGTGSKSGNGAAAKVEEEYKTCSALLKEKKTAEAVKTDSQSIQPERIRRGSLPLAHRFDSPSYRRPKNQIGASLFV